MMKVTIHLELTVDEDELGVEQIDLPGKIRYLCGDAFAEFQHPRRNAEEYVAKRYPQSEGYAWLNRENKVREVAARVELAQRLHNAGLQAVICVEPCCPECGAVEPHAETLCNTCRDACQAAMESADAQMGDSTP